MKFNITSYKISECGYYKQGDKVPHHHYRTPAIFFDEFHAWTQSHKIGEMVISRRNAYPVTVSEMQRRPDSDDYLLTTWNVREQHPGAKILGISKNSMPIGRAAVKEVKMGEDSLPGIPTYFFIAAKEKVLATVRPEYAVINGHQDLDEYLTGYLFRHSKFVNSNNMLLPDELTVSSDLKAKKAVGIQGAVGTYFPRFSSQPNRTKSNIKYLRENPSKIRKLIHSMDLANETDKTKQGLLEKTLVACGIRARPAIADRMRIRYEIDMALDKEVLDDLIREWEEKPSTWDDIGFLLRGKVAPIWMDGGIGKQEIEIDVAGGVFSGKKLLSALEKIKPSIV